MAGVYGEDDDGAEVVDKRHDRDEHQRFAKRFVAVYARHDMRCEQQEVAAEYGLNQNARFVALYKARHDQAEQQHCNERDRDGIDYDARAERRPDVGRVNVVKQHHGHGELVDE